MTDALPCIAYAAKSSPDEKDATGTQLAEIRAAVEKAGGRTLVAEYAEENVTAFKGERGAKLEQAMAAARDAAGTHGEAELWVWHTSRLARGDGRRGQRSLLKVYADLRYEDVALRSVHDNEFVSNGMLVGIASEQNHKYSSDLSVWVKGGKDRQLQAGRRLGGPAPDGLTRKVTVDDAQRSHVHYEIDDDRAPILRRIFDLSESGLGDAAVARKLNAEGYRTKAGKSWSRRRIQDTVTNGVYAGRIERYRGKPNQETVPATNVPALIDGDRFDAIQAGRRTRDRSAAGRAKNPGGRPTGRYALSRLATCAHPREDGEPCGSSMYCVTSPYKRKDGTQARHYVCAEVRDATGLCDAPKVPAEQADAAIVPHLRGFFVDFDAWHDRVTTAETADRSALAAQIADGRAKLGKLARAESAAQDRYADALGEGDATKIEAVERALSRFSTERGQAEASVAELEDALAAAEAENPTDGMLDFWNRLSEGIRGKLDAAQTVAEVNEALRDVLASVRVDTLSDGTTRLQAIFADRDEWWTEDGDLSPDAPPHYPNTLVAVGVPTRPIETGRNTHE